MVNRVLRRNEETRIYHRHKVTGAPAAAEAEYKLGHIMSQRSRDRPITDVAGFGVVGSLFLVLSFLPVGPEHRPLLLGASMPGAVMSSWIAAGLGLYGVVRYPSRRMSLVTTAAVFSAALCGLRFWWLALNV